MHTWTAWVIPTFACLSLMTFGWRLGAAELYWCPEQAGSARLQTSQDPGCRSLQEPDSLPTPAERAGLAPEIQDLPGSKEPLPPNTLTRTVTSFLNRYRSFLECCVADSASINQARQLEQEAAVLLKYQADRLGAGTVRLRRLQSWGVLMPVADAQDNLRAVQQRLEDLKTMEEQLESLDSEKAARLRRQIDSEKEDLRNQFHPLSTPPSEPTGVEIGTTPPTGEEVGTAGHAGPSVGRTGRFGQAIGSTPRTGPEIGSTPRTGPEIGRSEPSGPNIAQ